MKNVLEHYGDGVNFVCQMLNIDFNIILAGLPCSIRENKGRQTNHHKG